MNDPSLLPEVNRWVGVLIAAVGAVVVAPAGFRMLLESTWAALRRRGHRARGLLARWLPFFRRNQSVRVADVAGSASLAAVGTVSVSARAWHPAAPVDERIEALRTYVTEVEGRLNQLDHRFSLEIWDRKQAVGDLDRKLNQEVSELHLLLASKEQQTARIDSRGLPVIAAGIFLSGVPEALASALPWGLSWLFPVVGVWSAIAAAVPAWREAH